MPRPLTREEKRRRTLLRNREERRLLWTRMALMLDNVLDGGDIPPRTDMPPEMATFVLRLKGLSAFMRGGLTQQQWRRSEYRNAVVGTMKELAEMIDCAIQNKPVLYSDETPSVLKAQLMRVQKLANPEKARVAPAMGGWLEPLMPYNSESGR